jgi:uncharacterized protein YegJ (DUF2314 family)
MVALVLSLACGSASDPAATPARTAPDASDAAVGTDAKPARADSPVPTPTVTADHDAELLAASTAAKEELAALKPRFENGTPPMEVLVVKAPFRTRGGGHEWMWVEVTAWNGNKVLGILQNDPSNVPGLEVGAEVEVLEDSILDYVHKRADGTRVGNATEAILMRRQQDR